jgi:hypothetical protein
MLIKSAKYFRSSVLAHTITVDFVHIFWWNSNDTTLLNHFRIFPNNGLHNLKVLHSDLSQSVQLDSVMLRNIYQWLDAIFLFPAKDLAGVQIDDGLKDFTSSPDTYYIRNTGWSWCVVGILDPSYHLHLARLPQCDSVEEDIAVLLSDKCDSCFDLKFAQRVKGVWRRNLSCQM